MNIGSFAREFISAEAPTFSPAAISAGIAQGLKHSACQKHLKQADGQVALIANFGYAAPAETSELYGALITSITTHVNATSSPEDLATRLIPVLDSAENLVDQAERDVVEAYASIAQSSIEYWTEYEMPETILSDFIGPNTAECVDMVDEELSLEEWSAEMDQCELDPGEYDVHLIRAPTRSLFGKRYSLMIMGPTPQDCRNVTSIPAGSPCRIKMDACEEQYFDHWRTFLADAAAAGITAAPSLVGGPAAPAIVLLAADIASGAEYGAQMLAVRRCFLKPTTI